MHRRLSQDGHHWLPARLIPDPKLKTPGVDSRWKSREGFLHIVDKRLDRPQSVPLQWALAEPRRGRLTEYRSWHRD
jgi:hypothetical protein